MIKNHCQFICFVPGKKDISNERNFCVIAPFFYAGITGIPPNTSLPGNIAKI